MAKRNKHIGIVVEPEVYDKLRAIADEKYMTLSTFIYSVLKEMLKRDNLARKCAESDSRG